MIFRHDCEKHGHRYEARYDKGPSQEFRCTGHADSILKLAEMHREVTYVRDICTHCGHVIERDRKPDLRAVS